jgi:isochorismate pyruvate lyase
MRIPAQDIVSRTGMDTLSEVRAAIDEIDDKLIALLAARLEAVKRAAELKDHPHEARVPWRVEEVTRRVRNAAAIAGFDPDAAERIWRAMMEECIAYEQHALAERIAKRRESSR